MILHGCRAGSPVVTDTGCCPPAAPAVPERERLREPVVAVNSTVRVCMVLSLSRCYPISIAGLTTVRWLCHEPAGHSLGHSPLP
jgi:hypothetical protein